MRSIRVTTFNGALTIPVDILYYFTIEKNLMLVT